MKNADVIYRSGIYEDGVEVVEFEAVSPAGKTAMAEKFGFAVVSIRMIPSPQSVEAFHFFLREKGLEVYWKN